MQAAKVGVSLAGGIIIGPGATTVLVEGTPLSTVGDDVTSHGVGAHAAALTASGSTTVLAEAEPACRQGDLATCGHAITNGATTVLIG